MVPEGIHTLSMHTFDEILTNIVIFRAYIVHLFFRVWSKLNISRFTRNRRRKMTDFPKATRNDLRVINENSS